jgi:hypothetical protein
MLLPAIHRRRRLNKTQDRALYSEKIIILQLTAEPIIRADGSLQYALTRARNFIRKTWRRFSGAGANLYPDGINCTNTLFEVDA